MKFRDDRVVHLETDFFLTTGEVLPVLTFAAWDKLTGVRHCFTTRDGGVSEGYLSSLNFRKNDIDTEENLYENFSRVAEYFDTTPDRIVGAQQTHTANIRCVMEADAGKGVTRERDYSDIDGLVTDVEGLVLFTSHADCVPLYFYDPKRRVIGLAHAGWRGTVAGIGAEVIRLMRESYGCDAADIYAAIGPSICADCYEVSEDVAEEYRRAAAEGRFLAEELVTEEKSGAHGSELGGILRPGRAEGKYQLDLWRANAAILRGCGITDNHLTVTNLCTCENSEHLFSHRATNGKRGNLGAFIMLEGQH